MMDVGIEDDVFKVHVNLLENTLAPQEALNLLGGLLDIVDNDKAREHLEYCVNYCQLLLESRKHDN